MGFVLDEDVSILDPASRSPLIGLYSTFKELKNLEYVKVLVLPCDSPLVKFEVINFLIKQCNEFDCCIPKWNNNLLEPLIAIYPIEKAYETSLRNIQMNQYKLTKVISKDWKTKYISIERDIKKIDPYLLSFKNVNKREDIKILKSDVYQYQ
jgi:molybdopterin-guanine dinucleotide biosynthesis protein A